MIIEYILFYYGYIRIFLSQMFNVAAYWLKFNLVIGCTVLNYLVHLSVARQILHYSNIDPVFVLLTKMSFNFFFKKPSNILIIIYHSIWILKNIDFQLLQILSFAEISFCQAIHWWTTPQWCNLSMAHIWNFCILHQLPIYSLSRWYQFELCAIVNWQIVIILRLFQCFYSHIL